MQAHFDGLTPTALKALGEHKPGASPLLHFSMVSHPIADPTFQAIWNTLSETRKYTTVDSVAPILTEAAQCSRIHPKPGPSHLLLQRMHQLHWQWNMFDSFVDHAEASIDVWNCPSQELLMRAVEAWQHQVSGQISSRKSFAGMQHTNASISTRKLPTEPIDHGLMRTIMNGTFYTADHLPKRDETLTDACPFCSQPDSVAHRNWYCPALEEARAECPMNVWQELLSMPPAVHNHGWFPTPPSLLSFQRALDQVHDTSTRFQPAPALPSVLDLFTDGSCLGPADKFERLAAWGVVGASHIGESDFFPVSSGLLPGRYQSITRAEMLAAISAVSFAVSLGKPFRIWVETSSVVSCIRRFGKNSDYTAKVNKPNHDLLQMLFQAMSAARHLFRGVFKVYSHQNLAADFTPAERWVLGGNQAADDLATTEFLQLRQHLMDEVKHTEVLRDWAHHVFTRVGRKVLQSRRAQQKHDESTENPRVDLQLTPLAMKPWLFPSELPDTAKHYHIGDWPMIAEGISSLHQDQGDVLYWSWFQLYADFQLMFPMAGPWFNLKKLRWESRSTMPNAIFVKRTRWLTTYLMNLAKVLTIVMPVQYRSPNSHTIH